MSSNSALSIEVFDCRGQASAAAREAELAALHQAYLDEQPELREYLHDLMQAVLVHKPEDPLAFISAHLAANPSQAPAAAQK